MIIFHRTALKLTPLALGLVLAFSQLAPFALAEEACVFGSPGQCTQAPNGVCSRGGVCMYPELQPQAAQPEQSTQPGRLEGTNTNTTQVPTNRGGQVGTPRGGQEATGSSPGTLLNPLRADSLQDLLVLVLRAVVQIGMIVLTLMIIWVGFLFVWARGNEEKIRDARRALFYTIIGGLILLGAQAIGMAIQSTVDSITR